MKNKQKRFENKIKDVAPDLRPRERLKKYGEKKLSSTELLAIIIGSGTQKYNALKIASRIIKHYGINNLPELTLQDWKRETGIGHIKACQLISIFELAKRIFSNTKKKKKIQSGQDVFLFCKGLRLAKKEHLLALYLDSENYCIKKETISIGRLNTNSTLPQEIFHPAVKCDASSVILVHNHPGGRLSPSKEDIKFSRIMKEAGDIIGVELIDHFIIGKKKYTSIFDTISI